MCCTRTSATAEQRFESDDDTAKLRNFCTSFACTKICTPNGLLGATTVTTECVQNNAIWECYSKLSEDGHAETTLGIAELLSAFSGHGFVLRIVWQTRCYSESSNDTSKLIARQLLKVSLQCLNSSRKKLYA